MSSCDQRTYLEVQVGRVIAWCAMQGICVDEVVCEVGAGVNGRRAKLARFGIEHLTAALAATGSRIAVVNTVVDTLGTTDDLVRDMVEMLTSMCAPLYGRRGARNRAMLAVAVTATKYDTGEAAG